jgi:photosystem II stability/assembly factor-like uncharacterized protein
MSDDELERRLRAHYRSFDPRLAPVGLGIRISDALEVRPSRPAVTLRLGQVLAAALIVAVGLAFGLSGHGPTVLPSASPSGSVSPVLSATPTPSAPSGTPTAMATIDAAQLIDPQHGWVVADTRLLVTVDGGSNWRDRTPPPGMGGERSGWFLGAAFLDALHGWVAINEAFTSPADPSYGRVDIWRTTDGGQSWARTQLPKARFAVFGEIMPGVQFDFLDATHGFAFQSGNEAKGKNDSDLFWTSDGGATWSADRPTGSGGEGIEGTVGFATANDGVIVDALHGNGVVVTRDGGRTWTDPAFPVPSASSEAQLFFDQPIFSDAHSGLMAVDFQSTSGVVSHVSRIYETSDAGSSWTIAATLPADYFTVSILGPQRWIAFDLSSVVRTVDAGATWTKASSNPPNGYSSGPQFANGTTGWWLAAGGVGTGLLATSDGGVSWHALAAGTPAGTPSP